MGACKVYNTLRVGGDISTVDGFYDALGQNTVNGGTLLLRFKSSTHRFCAFVLVRGRMHDTVQRL